MNRRRVFVLEMYVDDEFDSGFSFGMPSASKPPRPSDDDQGDVDAIDVSGEPVSRSEAKNMGLASFESGRHAARSAATRMRLDQLPADVSSELAGKLEKAWQHLKRNETDQALTVAQEVVWEYPSLVAAKLIIARCFINRKEYEKGLAILQAVAESDKNAECYYYIGLCQSRLGRLKDAIDSLKRSRSSTKDDAIRRRAGDLLMHLQGEQAVCEVCGKKALYDSMVEVGNRLVCANCAKSDAADDDDDEYDDDEYEYVGNRRRRRRLRPPLSRTDVLMRLLAVLFVFLLLTFGVYLLFMLAPSYYASFRSYFPASWRFLPQASPVGSETGSQGARPAPELPRIVPGLVFNSKPIETAVVGVEVRRRLRVSGMGNAGESWYSAQFYPNTSGPFTLDQATGSFTWTPGADDAGKEVELTFGGSFNKIMLTENQVNMVKVSSGPAFKKVGTWKNASPVTAQYILAEDFIGDAAPELVLLSGEYWRGMISIFQADPDGLYTEVTSTAFSGHPAGVGIIRAGEEKWLAIADYWNARIRYYTVRDGNIAEMAITVELPGRPVLAAFHRELSISVALCQTADGFRAVAYQQDGQLNFNKIGEWDIVGDTVWKRLFVIPGDNRDAPPNMALVGADLSDSVLFLAVGKDPRAIRTSDQGVVIDAAMSGRVGRLYCLVASEGQTSLVHVDLVGNVGLPPFDAIPLGEQPLLGGLAVEDFDGDGVEDILALASSRLGVVFGGEDGAPSPPYFWSVTAPSRLFGGLAAFPAMTGRGGQAVFVDTAGDLWLCELVY